MKIWLNGHEWAKRQASKAGIGFTELSNGFATATDPAALQAICDRLGPQDSGHRGGSLLTSLAFFLVAACFWVCR